jgi:outer membrane protein insertion porin family
MTSVLFAQSTYKAIEFKGLSQISKAIALETSKFKPNQKYTNIQINKTLKKFFEFGYFKDISVEDIDNKLIFIFKEKLFVAQIDMEGYKTRDDDLDVLYSTIGIKKGNMHSKEKLKVIKLKLLEQLKQEGYVNSVVEVEVNKLNDNSVAIKFLINKGSEIIIQKFNYNGAKKVSINDMEDVCVNKEAESISWFFGQNNGVMNFDQLEYDGLRIKDVYLENGFLDVKVGKPFSLIDFNTNTSIVDINIEEGKQYKVNNIVIYVDEKIIEPKTIYSKLTLKKGRIFNIKKLRKDTEYIKTLVANKGYAFVRVKYDIRKDIIKGTTDVIYNVLPGDKVYINDVLISGNHRTLDRVIRRDVYLATSDLFNITDLIDSKGALKRTGFFEKVKIDQKRISKNKMDLLVHVQEAATGNFIFGGGYGSYDGFIINGSLSDKNIFGSGLNLGLSAELSKKTTTYALSIKNPAISDGKYSGSASIHKRKNEITYTDSNLIKESMGLSLGIGRSFSRYTRVGATYTLDKIDEVYNNTTADKHYISSSITPYISFDNTDSYLLPRQGMIASTSLEIAGIGGDTKYIKSNTSYKYFKGVDDYIDYDAIIRYRAHLGFLQDRGYVTQGNSFYLGGVNSVRGYKSYAFGPATDAVPYSKTFTNSAEISMPLIPKMKMRWGLFYDYGMIGENSFTQIKRSGTGVLIEWTSPVGPIQFIFAKAIDAMPEDSTTSFEFSLGSIF